MLNRFYLKIDIFRIVLFCVCFNIQNVHSADITYELSQGNDTSISFELGVQVVFADIPIVGWVSTDPDDPTGKTLLPLPIFEGRFQWKGLFLEANSNSFSLFGLGYSPWSNENTSVDLVLSDGLGQYEPGIGAFESVEKRDANVFAGVRSTHHFENTLVQFEIHSDVLGTHDGQMAAVQAGRIWQVRNWSLHGLVGARYLTANFLDYYFGITERESTAEIPPYEASGGTLGTLEIGGTLPLTNKWIFKSNVQSFYLPDSVSASPLADGRIGIILSSSVSYVF